MTRSVSDAVHTTEKVIELPINEKNRASPASDRCRANDGGCLAGPQQSARRHRRSRPNQPLAAEARQSAGRRSADQRWRRSSVGSTVPPNAPENVGRSKIASWSQGFLYILRSRHNPKILGVDDTEIVGDRITEVRPIPRNLFTQKTERCVGKLGASCVALVVRDVSVHETP